MLAPQRKLSRTESRLVTRVSAATCVFLYKHAVGMSYDRSWRTVDVADSSGRVTETDIFIYDFVLYDTRFWRIAQTTGVCVCDPRYRRPPPLWWRGRGHTGVVVADGSVPHVSGDRTMCGCNRGEGYRTPHFFGPKVTTWTRDPGVRDCRTCSDTTNRERRIFFFMQFLTFRIRLSCSKHVAFWKTRLSPVLFSFLLYIVFTGRKHVRRPGRQICKNSFNATTIRRLGIR